MLKRSMRLLLLVATLLAPCSPRSADAAAGPDRETQPFRGRVYEAGVRSGRVWVTPSGGRGQNLGGRTNYSVGLGATDRFMVVARHGPDDRLQVKVTTDGRTYADGRGNAGAWRDLGGVLSDSPVAFERGGCVTVVVTGGDRTTRYENYTCDGATFSGWAVFRGQSLPLGANLIGEEKDFPDYQLAAIRAMGGNIVRLNMFYDGGGPSVPRYNADQIEALIEAGVRTIIIRGCESRIYPSDTQASLDAPVAPGVSLLQYIRAHPNTAFYFELGNEPDQTVQWGFDPAKPPGRQGRNDPYGARFTALDTLDQIANGKGYRASVPNLRWMIGQPSDRGGAGSYTGRAYFDAFNANRDGRGVIGQRFDAMAVHTYSFSFLNRATLSSSRPGGQCLAPGRVPSPHCYHALATVDWARAVASTPIYVTEAGIIMPPEWTGEPHQWLEIAGRYVDALQEYDAGPNGRVRGVTFFDVGNKDAQWYQDKLYTIDVYRDRGGAYNPDLTGSHRIGRR